MTSLEWLAQAGDAWVSLLEEMTDAGVAFEYRWLRELEKAQGRLAVVNGEAKSEATTTDENVYAWAIRGSAGWLKALESASDRGENFGPTAIAELTNTSERLRRVIRRQRELNGLPVD